MQHSLKRTETNMAHIISNIVHGVEQVKNKVKQNYKYYKMGRKAEFDEENRKLRQTNKKRLQNIKSGNPEKNFKYDKY